MRHEYNPEKKWTWSEYIGDDEDGNPRSLDITMSEKDILKEYYPYWSKAMIIKYGEEHFEEHYSFGDCVDGYIAVNWATPALTS